MNLRIFVHSATVIREMELRQIPVKSALPVFFLLPAIAAAALARYAKNVLLVHVCQLQEEHSNHAVQWSAALENWEVGATTSLARIARRMYLAVAVAKVSVE